MISNQDRLNLIRSFCEDDFENEVENVLKDIFEKGSYELKSLIKLFNLMDNSIESDLQVPYTIGNRTIEIINTSEQLEKSMNEISLTPFIGFDSEQKPTFKKGETSHGICLVQLATVSKCYLIQIKQINDFNDLFCLLCCAFFHPALDPVQKTYFNNASQGGNLVILLKTNIIE